MQLLRISYSMKSVSVRIALALLAVAPMAAAAAPPPTAPPATQAPSDAVLPSSTTMMTLAEKCFLALEKGRIDRSTLTDNGNRLLSNDTLSTFAKELAPIGVPSAFVEIHATLAQAVPNYIYRVTSHDGRHYLLYSFTFDTVSGKVAELHLGPVSRT